MARHIDPGVIQTVSFCFSELELALDVFSRDRICAQEIGTNESVSISTSGWVI
jgi:hypothetical protein